MKYEVLQSRFDSFNWQWRAEAIDENGECYVTIFSGPEAEARAREYADWKNGNLHK